EDEVAPLLDLLDDPLQPLLEHPAEHRAGDDAGHLQLDDVRVAQPRRYFRRIELDHTGETFDDGGLADPRLADEHRRIGPLAVAEDFDHLLDLALTTDDRGQFVLPGELVERDAEMFQVRRKFVFLAERFGLLFARADALSDSLGGVLGVDAQPPQNLGGAAALVGEKRGGKGLGFYSLGAPWPGRAPRPAEKGPG